MPTSGTAELRVGSYLPLLNCVKRSSKFFVLSHTFSRGTFPSMPALPIPGTNDS